MPDPKNIVLLSDGTGNSAAKLMKTNVWRLYESLDLRDPLVQVACYDDGVGSSPFKPLALLGGAIGVGLKRNVLRLYRFLCEHYNEGDRIYLFGFSRGAFTVRVLAGLILTRGIIKTRPTLPAAAPPSDVEISEDSVGAASSVGAPLAAPPASGPAPDPEDPDQLPYGKSLTRLAAWEYRRYRREKYSQYKNLAWWGRPVRDFILAAWQAFWLGPAAFAHLQPRDAGENGDAGNSNGPLGRARFAFSANGRALASGGETARYKAAAAPAQVPTPFDPAKYDCALGEKGVRIQFIGVWDTVDAYGLPIDELTQGIDRWIWPLSFQDQRLDKRVVKACHVLALNDERHSFHPVLWDESENTPVATLCKERITQVWFAGMHANVGGGYPDDALSAVSFKWMVSQITPSLKMVRTLLQHHARKADLMGRIYDSRTGLKAYYRYNPRRVESGHTASGRNSYAEVSITKAKIHESVFKRIEAAPEAYAPIGVPSNYSIVKDDGTVTSDSAPNGDPAANKYEQPNAAQKRAAAQERVWDFVWLRRLVYLANVLVTAVLLALPFVGDYAEQAFATQQRNMASRLAGTVLGFLPSYAASIAAFYTASPGILFGLLAGLGALHLASRALQKHISYRMRGIWLRVVPPYASLHGQLRDNAGAIRRLRAGRLAHLSQWVGVRTVPILFAGALLTVGATTAYLLYVAAAEPMKRFCQDQATAEQSLTTLALGDRSAPLEFTTRNPCTGTGLKLESGKRYHLQTVIGTREPWRDHTVEVQHIRGFAFTSPEVTWRQLPVFLLGAPFLRVWGANWFTPVAQIGIAGGDRIPIADHEVTFTATRTGELFLFVNDALQPFDWEGRYRNNLGTATVVVTRDWGRD